MFQKSARVEVLLWIKGLTIFESNSELKHIADPFSEGRMSKMISLLYLAVLDWYPKRVPLRDTEQGYYICFCYQ
jgi:hypothetical protein